MPRQARNFRTPALVLRRQDFGEADRLLTLLTPQHGKLRAIAKGARKPAARKSGHVELFALVDMLLARGRELYIVVQAELQEPFLPLRENLVRSSYASYLAELMDRFAGEDDSNPAEFDCRDCHWGRHCDDANPAPFDTWLIDGEPRRTCPKPAVTRASLTWLRLYRHYTQGHLLTEGGLMRQPARYLEAMEHIAGHLKGA